MRKHIVRLTYSLLTFAFLALTVSALTSKPPIKLKFEKALVSNDPVYVWEGTVSGDINGTLRTEMRSLRVEGAVWHVEFDFIVTAGSDSHTSRINGILNTKTGKVVMNGVVIEAENPNLIGAQVHEEGQLIDPATSRFAGTIRIMPQSRN